VFIVLAVLYGQKEKKNILMNYVQNFAAVVNFAIFFQDTWFLFSPEQLSHLLYLLFTQGHITTREIKANY
jgi:hypothetical protein